MNVNDGGFQQVVKFVVLGLLALGAVLRFANLNQKVYGYDETVTLMRNAGLTYREAVDQLYNNREIGIDDIQKLQRPNSERNLTHTVRSLATDVPQHAPLYFVMARLWANWFGNSPAASKSLPALLSLFTIPCAYWLCRELFGSSLSGWIAMGLLAISPFHVLYAQEARPYTLLIFATLLSSAALLRAVRIQTKAGWIFYSVTVALGLYCQLFSILVFTGHCIYVLAAERFRIGPLFVSLAVSVVAGFVSFLPWLVIVVKNSSAIDNTMKWTNAARPFPSMVRAWVGDYSRIFYDTGKFGTHFSSSDLAFLIVLSLATVTLAAYALWFLWRKTPKHVWLFIFSFIGATSLPLVASDLILSRHVSTNSRYLIAVYLGIQLALSFVLATKINAAENDWHRTVWRQIGIILALGGIVSCFAMSRAQVWSNRSHVYHNPVVADLINRTSRPLVLSDDTPPMVIFSLSYLLRPETRFLLLRNTAPEISKADNRDIFLFRPSVVLRKELEKDFAIEALYEQGRLWRLKR